MLARRRAKEDGEIIADAPQRSDLDALCGQRVEQEQRILDGPQRMGDAEAAPVRGLVDREGMPVAKVHASIVAARPSIRLTQAGHLGRFRVTQARQFIIRLGTQQSKGRSKWASWW
jgi:hypothetical protein